MIHEPTIEVTCDACGNRVTITPKSFSLLRISGPNRDCSDYGIEKVLRNVLGWTCQDGKQFCCAMCAEMSDEP